jgi:hypothetical protein
MSRKGGSIWPAYLYLLSTPIAQSKELLSSTEIEYIDFETFSGWE